MEEDGVKLIWPVSVMVVGRALLQAH